MFNYLHYRCSHPFSRPLVRDLWQMDEDGFGVSACGRNVVECGKVCPVADVQPCAAGGLCGDAALYKAIAQFLYRKLSEIGWGSVKADSFLVRSISVVVPIDRIHQIEGYTFDLDAVAQTGLPQHDDDIGIIFVNQPA